MITPCLAAHDPTVLISEFMARNHSSPPLANGERLDEDGESSDWIELVNPTSQPVDLAGWFLTDDPNDPAQWELPSGQVLGGGQFLIVWASGKDRRDPSKPLHTNFRLAGDGEYLALLRPDGSISSAYSPVFPEQVDNVSFGIVTAPEHLIAEGVTTAYRIPSEEDAPLDWTDPNLDDVSWPTVKTPLRGADVMGTGDPNLQRLNTCLWTRFHFELEPGRTDLWDRLTLQVRYEDGFSAFLNGRPIANRNAPAELTWDSAALSNRPWDSSAAFESFDIPDFRDLLRPGDNVLGIAGLNDEKEDANFLLSVECVAEGHLTSPQFFVRPTPGGPNAAGAMGRVSSVEFDPQRGFYTQPFSLTLSPRTEGARIRLTLDGSTPTATRGFLYEEGTSLRIDKTSTVRAIAFKPGWLDSEVVTHTYLFLEDVIRQSPNGEPSGPGWPTNPINGQIFNYGMDPDVVNDPRYKALIDDALMAIPSISLVTDLENLFDPAKGVYVNGTEARADGRAYERPVSMELIPPNGNEGFHINAGLRIRGGYSRSDGNPKHSFRLLFRSEYGQSTLYYPLFGDEGVDEFKAIDLATSQNYSWAFDNSPQNTLVRDVFSRDVQGQMGHPHTRSRYCHLYLNGQYWGLYYTEERPEASFGRSYLGGNEEDYDVVKSDWAVGRQIVSTDGTIDALYRLYAHTLAGFQDSDRYYHAQGLNLDGTPNPAERLLDVNNLIDFMIIEYYTGDRDGPGSRFGNIPNNTVGLYNRATPDGFKWVHHDNEHALGANSSEENMVTPFTTAGANKEYFNPHWLHEQLMLSQSDYRMAFADRVYRHFFNDGCLIVDKARQDILERASQIDLAIIAESARWGDSRKGPTEKPFTKDDHWWPEIQRIITGSGSRYIPNRIPVVLNQFRSVGWYPRHNPPVFSRHGGRVAKGYRLTLTSPQGTIYYTLDSTDPRVTAARSGPGTPLTLVPESATKRISIPKEGSSHVGGDAILAEYWTNVTGDTIEDLTSNLAFPGSPSSREKLPYFEIPANQGDQYGTRVRGYLYAPTTGTYTFWIASNGQSQLWLSPDDHPDHKVLIANVPDSTLPREWTRYPSQQSPPIPLTGGRQYYIEALHKEGSGSDHLAVAWERPGFSLQVITGRLLSPGEIPWMDPDFKDTGWRTAVGTIGFETRPSDPINYADLIGTDVQDLMANQNATCQIRIPFTLAPTPFKGLTLRIKYDDGFIAYLNGTECVRVNLDPNASPQWDSTAGRAHPDEQAVQFESFDLSKYLGLLRTGQNVLAVHGLNHSASDNDFLISVEMVGAQIGQGDVAPAAIPYTSPIELTETSVVKARVFDGTWSALAEAAFTVDQTDEP